MGKNIKNELPDYSLKKSELNKAKSMTEICAIAGRANNGKYAQYFNAESPAQAIAKNIDEITHRERIYEPGVIECEGQASDIFRYIPNVGVCPGNGMTGLLERECDKFYEENEKNDKQSLKEYYEKFEAVLPKDSIFILPREKRVLSGIKENKGRLFKQSNERIENNNQERKDEYHKKIGSMGIVKGFYSEPAMVVEEQGKNYLTGGSNKKPLEINESAGDGENIIKRVKNKTLYEFRSKNGKQRFLIIENGKIPSKNSIFKSETLPAMGTDTRTKEKMPPQVKLIQPKNQEKNLTARVYEKQGTSGLIAELITK